MEQQIDLPLDPGRIGLLHVYDTVLLSGTLLVARDQVHRRLYDLIRRHRTLPVSLEGQTCYYMGPAATPPGLPIGSCGPTTAERMDRFTPCLMDAGLIATIGKGPRSREVLEAVRKHKGLYLVAFGGCGALYASCVVSQQVVAFAELGPEAMVRLEVRDFPVIVGIDSTGKSVFD